MRIINEIENYSIASEPFYLVLGNFDGVHLGHKKLIGQAVSQAVSAQGIAGAFIFEPHPYKIINPRKCPQLLLSAARKANILEGMGLDIVIYNSFTPEIAGWSPEIFVKKILVDKLRIRKVFVGFNYSFGYRGLGSPATLKALGETYGFKVEVVEPVEVNGEVVSSTLIRQALAQGDIVRARAFLGYYPMIEGQVIYGEGRGKKLGFPTANIGINPEIMIPDIGVYAGLADIKDKRLKCVVNIGRKPTFYDSHPLSVEAHVMDFAEDIYGQTLKLSLIDKIRDEKKFANLEELVRQIEMDCNQAADIIVI